MFREQHGSIFESKFVFGKKKKDTIPKELSSFLLRLQTPLRRDFSVLWYYWTGEINKHCIDNREDIEQHPQKYEYDATYERLKKNLPPYLLKTFEKIKSQFDPSPPVIDTKPYKAIETK